MVLKKVLSCCFSIALLVFLFLACKKTVKTDAPDFTNELIQETSPYLLQHAHNPVN